MTITYFVETNRIHKYLAFDAAESILGRIEEKLNQKNLLVGDGEIRRSMRAARNGYYYEYYTRLRNTVTNSQIQTIFHKLEQPLIDLKEVFTFSKKYHAIKF